MSTSEISSGFLTRHAAKIYCVLILSLPLLASQYLSQELSSENRAMANFPPLPSTLASTIAYPAALEPAINDRFAMRAQLVKLNTWMRYTVFRVFPTPQVIEGRNGYNFLASHHPQGQPYGAIRIACGEAFTHYDYTLQQLNSFAQAFGRRGLSPKILVVPSGPVVYREHLPQWLAERCPLDQLPMSIMLASPKLSPAARSLIYFPLAEIRALGPDMPAMPQHYFHWRGGGPKAIAEATEQYFWKRPPQLASRLPLVYADGPSDYHWLYPGIEVIRKIGMPDFAGTAITPCEGSHCFPELAAQMKKLSDVARYRNTAPGLAPRLVIIGDSFAPNAAPWFARYYQEVIMIGTNFVTQLNAAERKQVVEFLYRRDSGDEILYIYHDATVYSGRVGADLEHLLLPQLSR